MMENQLLNQYFEQFKENINKSYFLSLYEKYQNPVSSDLKIFHPETAAYSHFFPYAILEDKTAMPVVQYKELAPATEVSSPLKIVKMHAGIGSSVKRADYLKEKTGRVELGSKSTDLFIGDKSIASLQMEQVRLLNQDDRFLGKVKLQNLVNEETAEIVNEIHSESEFVEPQIFQYQVPTIDESGNLTLERKAPSGHAFLGFYLLMNLYQSNSSEEILAIGNGEDLNSTPDIKILNWMEKEEIPICMITTTKTAADKKGGQLGLVKGEKPFLAIFEKAQAEKANQLEYFELLGLREGDGESLFNTNIVVINSKVLKEKLNQLKLSAYEFGNIISPDLIKNKKEQDGKTFIQLEGAIGSVMLNLDKYFRQNLEQNLITFLNLDPVERNDFFIPIKKMEDFEQMLNKYHYSEKTGRLELR